ncbi:hypothetical protein BKA70DRAFT_1271460 [Coprinopsis sp. MPI-PUGE-AT-0042]|nr:hypothetical protein BKA70DRAFT_1271460 [Coprinopsis sp. MPI-PUGE-AT-0042]
MYKPITVEIISMVYGGLSIVDPIIVGRFREAITKGREIVISNENLGGDPDYGTVKTFVIEYKNGGEDNFVKRRRMMEYETLDFGWDIVKATYGGNGHTWSMTSYTPAVEALFWALDHEDVVLVTNQLAGFDPAYGWADKIMEVVYTHDAHRYVTSAKENYTFEFSQRFDSEYL